MYVQLRGAWGMQPCSGAEPGEGQYVAQRGNGRGSEYQRQQQALRRAQEQRARQAERERKAAEAAGKRQERERKAAYLEQQAEQAQARTIGVEHEAEQLGKLLRDALVGDPPTTFERRGKSHTPKVLDERPWSRPGPSPRWEEFSPPEPGGMAAVLGLGRMRHEAAVAEARVRFGEAQERHRRAEEKRLATLEAKRDEHRRAEERALAEVAAFNRQLDEEREAYRAGERGRCRQVSVCVHPGGRPSGWNSLDRLRGQSAGKGLRVGVEDVIFQEASVVDGITQDSVQALQGTRSSLVATQVSDSDYVAATRFPVTPAPACVVHRPWIRKGQVLLDLRETETSHRSPGV